MVNRGNSTNQLAEIIMKSIIPTGFEVPAISFETFRRLVISYGDQFDEALEAARKLGLTKNYIKIYSTQE